LPQFSVMFAAFSGERADDNAKVMASLPNWPFVLLQVLHPALQQPTSATSVATELTERLPGGLASAIAAFIGGALRLDDHDAALASRSLTASSSGDLRATASSVDGESSGALPAEDVVDPGARLLAVTFGTTLHSNPEAWKMVEEAVVSLAMLSGTGSASAWRRAMPNAKLSHFFCSGELVGGRCQCPGGSAAGGAASREALVGSTAIHKRAERGTHRRPQTTLVRRGRSQSTYDASS